MKAGLVLYGNRISSLFETGTHLLVAEYAPAEGFVQSLLMLENLSFPEKVNLFKTLGITHIICGAISGVMQKLIEMEGIVVIPFVGGKKDEVLQAFFENRIFEFQIPGCCRRRRRGMRRGFRKGGRR